VRAILSVGREAVQSVHKRTLEALLTQAHLRLDEAEAAAVADGETNGDLLVKAVTARAKLAALEFGSKPDPKAPKDPKAEFDSLGLQEKRKRLAEAKTRVAELEAEVAGGEH
jgi:hypothetical protein